MSLSSYKWQAAEDDVSASSSKLQRLLPSVLWTRTRTAACNIKEWREWSLGMCRWSQGRLQGLLKNGAGWCIGGRGVSARGYFIAMI